MVRRIRRSHVGGRRGVRRMLTMTTAGRGRRRMGRAMATVHRARMQHPGIAEYHGEPEREQCVQQSGEAGKAAHGLT
jgi:hypothetical protein